MAYVKNVTDETAITGAFLNSDDTGLTTNVFLTEPRLYGLRVTKAWTGGPLLGSFGARREGPYPFTLELGGQTQRHEAPNGFLDPGFADEFDGPLAVFDDAQADDLDWGDGRELRLIWRPDGGRWVVSAGVRYGKTNGRANRTVLDTVGGDCVFGGDFAAACPFYAADPKYLRYLYPEQDNHAITSVIDREEHNLVDFSVGADVGLGSLRRSVVSVGVRYAQLDSTTTAALRGVPDWNIPEGSFAPGYPITHTTWDGHVKASREFEGAGPVVTWDAALALLDLGEAGQVDLDWSVQAGALFGDQTSVLSGSRRERDYLLNALQLSGIASTPTPIFTEETELDPISRTESVTAPTAGVSLGLSYAVDRFSIGAGYRWERYFDVIDGGFEEQESRDRTIDGPYLKLSLGFGG